MYLKILTLIIHFDRFLKFYSPHRAQKGERQRRVDRRRFQRMGLIRSALVLTPVRTTTRHQSRDCQQEELPKFLKRRIFTLHKSQQNQSSVVYDKFSDYFFLCIHIFVLLFVRIREESGSSISVIFFSQNTTFPTKVAMVPL